jgi:phosphoribosylglycinamide formyltransferase-1
VTGVFDQADYENRVARDNAIRIWLEQRDIDLVVLAGYMHLIDWALLGAFRDRVINVHPSMLPAFPGPTPIEDQIAAGVRESGVTVHYVDSGTDTGPVILQESVQLPYTRDREEILNLLHEKEHELLPRVIRLIAAGAVQFDPDTRVVSIDEGALSIHE